MKNATYLFSVYKILHGENKLITTPLIQKDESNLYTVNNPHSKLFSPETYNRIDK